METFILILMIFYQDGRYEHENRPVYVHACQVVNGIKTEDSSCGIRACMKVGKERADVLWGQLPGLSFGLLCRKADGSEQAEENTGGAGGGHPGLGFHNAR